MTHLARLYCKCCCKELHFFLIYFFLPGKHSWKKEFHYGKNLGLKPGHFGCQFGVVWFALVCLFILDFQLCLCFVLVLLILYHHPAVQCALSYGKDRNSLAVEYQRFNITGLQRGFSLTMGRKRIKSKSPSTALSLKKIERKKKKGDLTSCGHIFQLTSPSLLSYCITVLCDTLSGR